MQAPIWISELLTYSVHHRQIADHGGTQGVRDEGLLQSALNRPLNAYGYGEMRLPRLAASYAYGLAKNHPFLDGNKRTALTICFIFLKLNGYDITASREERFLNIIRLAEGVISEEAYAEWLEASILQKENV